VFSVWRARLDRARLDRRPNPSVDTPVRFPVVTVPLRTPEVQSRIPPFPVTVPLYLFVSRGCTSSYTVVRCDFASGLGRAVAPAPQSAARREPRAAVLRIAGRRARAGLRVRVGGRTRARHAHTRGHSLRRFSGRRRRHADAIGGARRRWHLSFDRDYCRGPWALALGAGRFDCYPGPAPAEPSSWSSDRTRRCTGRPRWGSALSAAHAMDIIAGISDHPCRLSSNLQA
jgi:hypothetical protein